jgi:hypothetical protein
MKHGPVPDPVARCRIRGIKQSLDFILNQIGNQPSGGFLEGNGENATDLFEGRGLPMLKEVEERLDCGEPDIAGLGGVSASILQVFQELANQCRIKLFQQQRRRRDLELFSRELEQQLKAVGIGIAGMLAGTTVVSEILAEEGLDVRCDQRHDGSPQMKVSAALAMSRSRSGVASRYQYVA